MSLQRAEPDQAVTSDSKYLNKIPRKASFNLNMLLRVPMMRQGDAPVNIHTSVTKKVAS